MEDSRFISLLLSLCLHSLILIMALFWPTGEPRVDLNQPIIEVGFVSLNDGNVTQSLPTPPLVSSEVNNAPQVPESPTDVPPVNVPDVAAPSAPILSEPPVPTPVEPPVPEIPQPLVPTPIVPPVPTVPEVPQPPVPDKSVNIKKEEATPPKPKEEEKPQPKPEPPKPEKITPPQPPVPPKPSAGDLLKDALKSAEKSAGNDKNANALPSNVPKGEKSVAAALAGMGKEAAKRQGGNSGGEGSASNSNIGVEATYTSLVMDIVRQRWASIPRSDRANLLASVRVRLSSNGTIEQTILEQSSGNPAYDASVLSALSRAGILPAPPNANLQDLLLNFNYNEMTGR